MRLTGIAAFRPQDREHTHFQDRKYQNHRLRPFQPFLSPFAFVDVLWFTLLRSPRAVEREGVHGTGSRRVELWYRAVRPGLRQGAL